MWQGGDFPLDSSWNNSVGERKEEKEKERKEKKEERKED